MYAQSPLWQDGRLKKHGKKYFGGAFFRWMKSALTKTVLAAYGACGVLGIARRDGELYAKIG